MPISKLNRGPEEDSDSCEQVNIKIHTEDGDIKEKTKYYHCDKPVENALNPRKESRHTISRTTSVSPPPSRTRSLSPNLTRPPSKPRTMSPTPMRPPPEPEKTQTMSPNPMRSSSKPENTRTMSPIIMRPPQEYNNNRGMSPNPMRPQSKYNNSLPYQVPSQFNQEREEHYEIPQNRFRSYNMPQYLSSPRGFL